jgi:hypothetical protein
MEQLLIAVGLVAVAAVIALVVQRRQPDPPMQPRTYSVPSQLDRADFDRPDSPWLVVAFTAATCSTCQGIWQKVQVLESTEVGVQEVEVASRPELHDRYQIDGVPLVVIADAEGVVRASFVGPATATDLWATVAELREPGSTPEECDHGQGDQQTGHAPAAE